MFQRDIGPAELSLIKFATIVTCVLGIFFILFYSHIKRFGPEIINYVQEFFRKLKLYGGKFFAPVIVLVTCTLLLKIFLAITIPINYDEAFTFLTFTSEGFLKSATFYPAPNNHILHSLFTNLTYYLPFNDTFNLRLPVIIVSSFTTILFFYFFSRLTNSKIAFCLTLIFSFLTPVIYYGFNSRGYYLILFFYLISFYSVIQLMRKDVKVSESKRYYFAFAGSSILGFYTMPSYLYPFLALASFLIFCFFLQKSSKNIKSTIITFLFIALAVSIIYTPIIIVSGFESLINNKFVEPISRSEVLSLLNPHFKTTFQYLFTLDNKITFSFLLFVFGILAISKLRSREVALIAFVLLFSPLILILHSVIPFARTWIFLIVPVLYLVGLFFLFIEKSQGKLKAMLPVVVLISVILLSSFFANIKAMEAFSYKAEELSNYILEKKPENIYVEHPLADISLAYLLKAKGGKISIYENDPLLKRDYDFLIFSAKLPAPSQFIYVREFGKDIYVYQVMK